MASLFRFGKSRQRKCFPIPITFSSDREAAVYAAKLAEKAGRYDEMMESMKKVAEMDVDLTIEERNLLSVAYNKVINSRRASRRMLCSIKHDEELKGNEQYANWIKEYRDNVESELTNICNEIVTVIDKHLIPSCTNVVSTVLYYKLKGDYYRYLAEFKAGDDGNDVADKSLKAYELATSLAETVLPPTHPLRLQLALNFSVFYYEILNSTERACHLANQAFDEIVSDEAYMDIILVLQPLRDNLALWTSEIPDDADEAQKRLRLEAKLQVANK